MKKVVGLMIVAATVLVLLAAACSPKAAPTPKPTPAPATGASANAEWQKVVDAAIKEGKVTGYAASTLAGDTGIAVKKAFEQKYPGIQLETVTGSDTNLVARVRAEYAAKKYEADFHQTTQTNLLAMKADGLLQSWGDLPVMKENVWLYFPVKYDPEGSILSFGRYFEVAYVNTDKVKPENEPKSYFDLLKPEWKGRINIVHPSTPMLAVLYASLKTNNVFDVDDYFTKLGKQDLKIASYLPDQVTQLAQGDADLAFASHEIFANPYIKKGAPVKPIYFKEGIPLRNSTAIAMLQGSPHPNAVRVFVNWLFSAEGQGVVTATNGSSPNRKDVTDMSPVSKVISPQAKTVFPQNPQLDLEASRVQTQQVLQGLMGIRK